MYDVRIDLLFLQFLNIKTYYKFLCPLQRLKRFIVSRLLVDSETLPKYSVWSIIRESQTLRSEKHKIQILQKYKHLETPERKNTQHSTRPCRKQKKCPKTYPSLKKIFHVYPIRMYLLANSKGKVDGNKINRQSASQSRFASTLFHFHPFAFAQVLSQSTSLTSTPLLRTRATLASTS